MYNLMDKQRLDDLNVHWNIHVLVGQVSSDLLIGLQIKPMISWLATVIVGIKG